MLAEFAAEMTKLARAAEPEQAGRAQAARKALTAFGIGAGAAIPAQLGSRLFPWMANRKAREAEYDAARNLMWMTEYVQGHTRLGPEKARTVAKEMMRGLHSMPSEAASQVMNNLRIEAADPVAEKAFQQLQRGFKSMGATTEQAVQLARKELPEALPTARRLYPSEKAFKEALTEGATRLKGRGIEGPPHFYLKGLAREAKAGLAAAAGTGLLAGLGALYIHLKSQKKQKT